jgi:transcription initiation factor TFIIE subunit beta
MSLAASLKSFNADRADAALRNARPATTSNTPARTATPQPAKRPHDAAFPSAPLAPGAGTEIMKLVVTTVSHLRSKQGPETFDEIVRYLSLPVDLKSPAGLRKFKQALQTHHRLQYIAATPAGGKDSFKYRPIHAVTNSDELREYLSRLDTGAGVSVRELKDGWPDCVPSIEKLEREGWVLLTRNKKDGTPKAVYPDNPAYHLTNPATNAIARPDDDFVQFWSRVKLPPNENDIRTELERAGLTPTSAVKEVKKVDMRKKERKRGERKNTKKTNVHMVGVLKDYSKMKK